MSHKWGLMWSLKSSDKVSVVLTLKNTGDNLSCEGFDLRLRSWHFPNQHTSGDSILSLQTELMQYLIREVALCIMNNMLWSYKMLKAVTCFITMFVKHLAFNPAELKHGQRNKEEFRVAWKSRMRADGNKGYTSYPERKYIIIQNCQRRLLGCQVVGLVVRFLQDAKVCECVNRDWAALLIMRSRQLKEKHTSLTLKLSWVLNFYEMCAFSQ